MTVEDAGALARAMPAQALPAQVPRRSPSLVRVAPRIALHPAWVLVAACCAAFVRALDGRGLSNDVYWQWAAGHWMLLHRALLSHDVFSYTVTGRHWVDQEWGFQVLLAATVRAVGPVAFIVIPAAACTIALVASVARWRRLGGRWLAVGPCAALATGALLLGDAPRPQTLSYACFALELYLLTRSRSEPRVLLGIPVLACVWANVHGSFLLAPLLVGLELAASVLSRPVGLLARPASAPSRALAGCLGLSLLAGMCNPAGPGLYRYAIAVSANPELGRLVSEWQSPDFHAPELFVLVAAPVAALVATLLARRRVDPFDLACFGLVLTMALHSQRFVPYLGIAFGGLAAGVAQAAAGRVRPMAATWPAGLALGLTLVLGGTHVAFGTPQRTGPDALPVVSLRYLAAHPGRVFSTYEWGDYLIEEGVPVFVDGRTDLYFGTGVLERYSAVASLGTDPDPILSRWHVRYVLWPSGEALARYLAEDPHWRVVERAGPAVVFEAGPR